MVEEPKEPTAESAVGAPPEESPPQPVGGGALRSVVGLFIVPLLVVVLCVAVFVGFGWIAYDQRTTTDYLNDLRSRWGPRRAQAAYELSKILTADPRALDDDPEARAELRRLYAEVEDGEIRRYLALVLGHTRDPEAVPLLLETLSSPDSQTRIYGLWALGSAGDRRALEPLIGQLEDSDAGIRKTAAFALGELGDGGAIPPLTRRLGDSTADVRWNAALALARLGSDAGREVLQQMLDRRLTSQVAGIRPDQQVDAMVSAVAALAAVAGESARPTLERLAEGDESLKVRQAALDALEALGAS